jgi:rhomboid protease GluP
MMDERLNNSFITMGYQRMNSNTQDIQLYYQVGEYELNIVSMIDAINGDEFMPQQYENILEQVKDSFQKTYSQRLKLLSIVITRVPDRAKHLFVNVVRDSHFIIDISTGRLMVYETQSGDFTAVRTMLEQFFEKEAAQTVRSNQPVAASPFTLINTGVILINIIAFLAVQFTMMFGGEERAFLKGSLSWYYVINKNQYYRLITSMFMHANWSHLLNNMFVMLFIGANVERAVGKLKYLFIYFGAGILAGLTSICYNMWKENGVFVFGDSVMAIGASGAIFGLVGALLYIVIANRGRLEQISTRQIIIFIVLSLYSGIINAQVDQADHFGGFLSGIVLALILYRRHRKKLKVHDRNET